MKLHDTLASHMAVGVIYMINNHGCNGLIREIMKEIDQSELSELDNRNISTFLETIAVSGPNLIIPILDDVMDYLTSEVAHFTILIHL